MRVVARPVRFGFLALLLSAGLAPAASGAPEAFSPASPRENEGEGVPASAVSLPVRSLRGIDVSTAPSGGDRVVLRLDGEPRYRLFDVEDPFRVVIDLAGTVSRVSRKATQVSSDSLHRVRAAQYQREPSPVARVVLDMNGRHAVKARVEGNSLVIDVAGSEGSGSRSDETAESLGRGSEVADSATAPEPARTAEAVEAAPRTPQAGFVDPSRSRLSAAGPPTQTSEPRAAVEPPAHADPPEPSVGAEPPRTADTHDSPKLVVGSLPGAPPGTVRQIDAEQPRGERAPDGRTSSPLPARPGGPETMRSDPAGTAGSAASRPAVAPVSTGSYQPSFPQAPAVANAPDAAGAAADTPAVSGTGADVPKKGAEAAEAPAMTGAAPETIAMPPAGSSIFEKKTIAGEEQRFTGKKISLNLVDADIRQVFRLFHEISGLNFVLDPGVSGRVTIVVDDVPWDQALDLILKNNGLDKVLDNNVIRIATTQKLAQEAGARKALKEAKELETDTVTITRTLSYAKARDVDQVIKTGVLLSPRGKSFFDERTNTIIITDVPTKIEPLDRLLTSLDRKTTQVMIEARIVETTREFVQDLGINWGLHGKRTDATTNPFGWEFPHNATVDWDLNLARNPGISDLAFSFSNISNSFALDLALDALETDGRARILSAPKIATRNNEEAEIEQGVRIPIVNTTATEINVEFVSASLKLKVTPQITAEGTVMLNLEVSNDTPELSIRTNTGTPGIRTQRAKTKVLVTDGGTTVIGGIFVVNEGHSEFGVPFLRKIPFFGWLFKSRNITNENRELLVFVTPKIIKG